MLKNNYFSQYQSIITTFKLTTIKRIFLWLDYVIVRLQPFLQ